MICIELQIQEAEIEMEGSLLEDLPGKMHCDGIYYDTPLIAMM